MEIKSEKKGPINCNLKKKKSTDVENQPAQNNW